MAAALAVAFFFLSGYVGWATILVWSIPALLLRSRARRTLMPADPQWPRLRLRVAWLAAVSLSCLAGLPLYVLPPDRGASVAPPLATLIGGLYVIAAWVSGALTCGVIAVATYQQTLVRHGDAV